VLWTNTGIGDKIQNKATGKEGAGMDYAQMKREKDARYEEYCKTYADQLRLQGYINSLKKDNEHLMDLNVTTFFEKRRLKKLLKINDKDIKKYNKALSTMPPVPPFS